MSRPAIERAAAPSWSISEPKRRRATPSACRTSWHAIPGTLCRSLRRSKVSPAPVICGIDRPAGEPTPLWVDSSFQLLPREVLMATAVDLVRAFRGLRVLVIGDVMLDSYLEGSATRLCTEGPVPVVRCTTEERAPGGAANTAANVRALGAQVMVLGLIGQDAPGALLRTALQDRDVDDRWLVEDPSVTTLHKQRILADDQYVVRSDSGETRHGSAAAREQLLAHLDLIMDQCDVVVVSDYRCGVLSDAV